MQNIDVPGHGRFEFDVDTYTEVWDSHREFGELQLRAIVASYAYDSIQDVNQDLSRFELIGMLAEFETNRDA